MLIVWERTIRFSQPKAPNHTAAISRISISICLMQATLPSSPMKRNRESYSRILKQSEFKIALKHLTAHSPSNFKGECANRCKASDPNGERRPTSDIAFTPAVKAIQTAKGSRPAMLRMESRGGWQVDITPDFADFIANLDMFYLGTANSDGQPYIQYRGGPKGFLKVIDERTLRFADFGGNRQYISVGIYRRIRKLFYSSWTMSISSESSVGYCQVDRGRH